jgi:EAL domain-containing protein (putative c-di-GMP-specific phosphodiesterase class I)
MRPMSANGGDGAASGPQADEKLLERMAEQLVGWEQPAARLRDALQHDHFRLYAQPILDLRGAAPAAFAEVLVRLREEEARMLPPGDFLPAFEHYRMMGQLDRWVVRNALRQLERWPVAALGVNVSAQTLEEPAFVPFVAMQSRMAGVDPGVLVFEIDENDALERRAAAERFAAAMKGIGCRILIDGFARRSVSFEPLKALLADFVKVDGSIVRHVLASGGAEAKLKAIVRVGEVTGIGVIAECVEEPAVLARLKELGVGYAQGFGVGRPEPIERLLGALR